MDLHDVALMLH